MEHRLIFKCWNCKRNYSLARELEGQLQLSIACPFCYKEGIVDLNLYLKSSTEVFKSAPPHQNHAYQALNLPEIIQTTQASE